MAETQTNDDDTKTKYTVIDVLMIIIVCCIYVIGVFFHTKIIKVCKKEKEMGWKLHVFDSCLKIVYYGMLIFMNGINYIITDTHNYTGDWFCYTYKVFVMYVNMGISGHSFVISALKYTHIVHSVKVRKFGKEKVTEIFFWINACYPIYINTVFTIVRPKYFFEYDGISAANRCLGLSDVISSQDGNRSATKLHDICEFTEPTYKNSIEYVVYVCRTSICWINVILVYANLWNVIEFFVYFQTFRFMKR